MHLSIKNSNLCLCFKIIGTLSVKLLALTNLLAKHQVNILLRYMYTVYTVLILQFNKVYLFLQFFFQKMICFIIERIIVFIIYKIWVHIAILHPPKLWICPQAITEKVSECITAKTLAYQGNWLLMSIICKKNHRYKNKVLVVAYLAGIVLACVCLCLVQCLDQF